MSYIAPDGVYGEVSTLLHSPHTCCTLLPLAMTNYSRLAPRTAPHTYTCLRYHTIMHVQTQTRESAYGSHM